CDLSGSGFSFLLAVASFSSGSGKFFWQWELCNWQWECLVHFIPNIFIVSTSLKRLLVVPRLSHESTSSLEELLEVSYRHGVFFVFTSGSRTLFIIIFFLAFKARDFLSTFALTISESFLMIIS
nr:hypothetical protein [Tanacetum cinerariifolium]